MDTADRVAPVLPLRDVVVYPHMAIPLFVGREKSMRALNAATQDSKRILLVAQRVADTDEPSSGDLYQTGTLASILQLLKLPDGTVKVLVEGVQRARILRLDTDNDYLVAEFEPHRQRRGPDRRHRSRCGDACRGRHLRAVRQTQQEGSGRAAAVLVQHRFSGTPGGCNRRAPERSSWRTSRKSSTSPTPRRAWNIVLAQVEAEIEILQIEKKIRGRVKQQMEKNQREYYLNEQMKAIQKELGELEDAPNEQEELARKIEKSGMPKPAKTKANERAQQAEDDAADVGRSNGGAQLSGLADPGAVESRTKARIDLPRAQEAARSRSLRPRAR